MNRRTIARSATAAAIATIILVLAAPLAVSAHIRVTPGQAEAGSSALLTFKVPHESGTAGTVKVSVDFPLDTPFTGVSYEPIAGWTAAIVTKTLDTPITTPNSTITEAPASVTWTADPGTEIGVGAFQQFVVSVSGVPDTGSILLPAHQTYSDGTVVDWDQPTPASGDEPEHPAPVVYINDPVPADEGAPALSATPTPSAAGSGEAGSGSVGGAAGAADALVPIALTAGIVGIVLGAIALTVSIVVLRRAREASDR
jgi:uncharacterized protein YcnI